MPPVFGPLSPSPTRLWSCAVPTGRQVVPSTRTKKLASSPSMNSSITTSAPAAPKAPPKAASTAPSASASVMATVTPLPAASPSALTTMGAPMRRMYSRAPSASSKRAQAAVGAPQASQISLVKALDASSRAAACDGPKAAIPAARSASATPAASGASGPITTRSIACSSQKATTAAPSSIASSAQRAMAAIPAFPGATISRSHFGFCRMAQASACSRPPPPRIRMFMRKTSILARACGRKPRPGQGAHRASSLNGYPGMNEAGAPFMGSAPVRRLPLRPGRSIYPPWTFSKTTRPAPQPAAMPRP